MTKNWLYVYAQKVAEGYNVLTADVVKKKFGRVIPKSQLSAKDLKEIREQSNAIHDKLKLPRDIFVN